MPKKTLETFEKTLLYSKKIVFKDNSDRRANNDNNLDKRSDDNLKRRINKFASAITKKIFTEFL